MSDLVECLGGRCPAGESTWSVLVDLVAPMILDFLVFSIAVGWVIRRRERKLSRRLVLISRARVATLADRLLCRLLPAGAYELAPRRIDMADGTELTLAYGGTSPQDIPVPRVLQDLRSRLRSISEAVSHARADLAGVIVASGHLLDVAELQTLSEFEMKLDTLERALVGDLTEDEMLDVAEILQRAAVAGYDIVKSLERR